MTFEEAYALTITCEAALLFDRRFPRKSSPMKIPIGLLQVAVTRVGERAGAEWVAKARACFARCGLDLSDMSSLVSTAVPATADRAAEPAESGEDGRKPANFIPRDGLLARYVKELVAEGYSQARIGRELRLNRRTVARLL